MKTSQYCRVDELIQQSHFMLYELDVDQAISIWTSNLACRGKMSQTKEMNEWRLD